MIDFFVVSRDFAGAAARRLGAARLVFASTFSLLVCARLRSSQLVCCKWWKRKSRSSQKQKVSRKRWQLWPKENTTGGAAKIDVDAEKDYSIFVGRTTVSGKLVTGRKAQKKAQALPQSGMARSEARYSGSLQEMGAKGGNIEERMDMAKRFY